MAAASLGQDLSVSRLGMDRYLGRYALESHWDDSLGR